MKWAFCRILAQSHIFHYEMRIGVSARVCQRRQHTTSVVSYLAPILQFL